MNLMFSSAGRRNHLIQCFRDDAVQLGINLKILAADVQPEWSPACQQADASFKVPHCTTQNFVPALLRLCEEHKVALLVPTIDTELAVLSRNREQFLAVGTHVVVSDAAVVSLANNKLTTAERLGSMGIPTPKTMSLEDYLQNPAQLTCPVIAKPKAGSASIGIVRPKSLDDLRDLPPNKYIVQELLLGREFTVNMFFDKMGVMRCAIPHERVEVRSGEVSKGVSRRIPMLEEAAKKMELALPGALGPLCFQAIVSDSGSFGIFEINARFGGGFPLAHCAGASFSRWLLEDAAGLPDSINNDWNDGVVMLRYDAAVYIHG